MDIRIGKGFLELHFFSSCSCVEGHGWLSLTSQLQEGFGRCSQEGGGRREAAGGRGQAGGGRGPYDEWWHLTMSMVGGDVGKAERGRRWRLSLTMAIEMSLWRIGGSLPALL